MKVVAFSAPKQLALTVRASRRDPIGPKTTEPNWTAMVVEVEIVEAGRTKM